MLVQQIRNYETSSCDREAIGDNEPVTRRNNLLVIPTLFFERQMPQPDFIEKALKTFRFHRSKLLTNEHWTMTLTAKELERSIGSVNQDIMIARWMRTHEKEILKCDTLKDAMEFIRKKKKNMDMEADV